MPNYQMLVERVEKLETIVADLKKHQDMRRTSLLALHDPSVSRRLPVEGLLSEI